MFEWLAVIVCDFYFVEHALRDHEAIDAVGGEVFHVAIKQAGAFAVEDAVAVADHGAHGGAGSRESDFANAFRNGTQIGM